LTSERTKCNECEGCGERPIVRITAEKFVYLLCDPCLEEQIHELETIDFAIEILPQN